MITIKNIELDPRHLYRELGRSFVLFASKGLIDNDHNHEQK